MLGRSEVSHRRRLGIAALLIVTLTLSLSTWVGSAHRASAQTVIVQVEEDASLVTYGGSYFAWGDARLSGSSSRWFESAGSVALEFDGTRLDWVTTVAPDCGIASVSVDGGAPEPIDLYSPTLEFQKTVWSTGELTSDSHRVVISWTGTKNTASSKMQIGFDRFDVTGTVKSPMPFSDVEENASLVTYGGSYFTWGDARLSGGASRWLTTTGSVTVEFDGTRLDWVTAIAPDCGIASVSVDGGAPEPIDLYSPTLEFQKTVWSTGELTSGSHRVVISWTGTKNTASSKMQIGFDRFDVTGTLKKPVAGARSEEAAAALTWAGQWRSYSHAALSGGVCWWTNTAGTSVDVAFEGTSFALISGRSPSEGIAEITVDGGTPVEVDLYAAALESQLPVYARFDLAPGPHTVRITCTGRRNPLSKGTTISIDAVEAQGALVMPMVEESEARIAKSGPWAVWQDTRASSGTALYVQTAGAYAEVAFTGTSLEWITPKNVNCGIAKVTVDGGEPALIDLYSPALAAQQTVWTTGALPAGDHTVRIEWTGQKNALATGTAITIDAFRVAGTLSSAAVPTEETSPLLAYSAATSAWGDARLSAGGYRWFSGPGSIAVEFDGRSMDWVTCVAPDCGIASVSVDGAPPVTVDLYSPVLEFQKRVYTTGDLAPGPHRIVISWTGYKNASATAAHVGFDRFDVVGAPQQATPERIPGAITFNYPWSRYIVIDKSDLKLYLVENGTAVRVYPVAVGKPSTQTPSAIWRVGAKYYTDPWSVYGPRKMRLFRQSGSTFVYTAYNIHGTNVDSSIGTYASHGCIRLHNYDILELFDLVPIGTMVVTRN